MIAEGQTGRLADEVGQASVAVVEVGRTHPDRWWTARELRAEAQNGGSPAAVMMAINRLVAEGRFERDDRLRVRLIA